MKTCFKCKEEKPDADFYKSGRTKDGLHCYCKVCCRETTASRKREYKKRIVEYCGGKCVICGYDKCYAALEFHHPNPEAKEPDFRQIMKNSAFEKQKELVKGCMMLCANCHREIHQDK